MLIISLIRCIIGTYIPRTISVKKEILRASLSNKAAFCESDFPLDTTAPFVFCALPCLGIYIAGLTCFSSHVSRRVLRVRFNIDKHKLLHDRDKKQPAHAGLKPWECFGSWILPNLLNATQYEAITSSSGCLVWFGVFATWLDPWPWTLALSIPSTTSIPHLSFLRPNSWSNARIWTGGKSVGENATLT